MAQRALITDRPELLDPPPRAEPGRPLDEESFLHLALAEPDRKWELHDGVLREKPGMSISHFGLADVLAHVLQSQLDWEEFRVQVERGRLRRTGRNYVIPDLYILPASIVRTMLRDQPDQLAMFAEPLPLVVEVWSPSTGAYDVNVKLKVYQERGDLEIWRIHPKRRTLTAWRRQADGSYATTEHRGGVIEPVAFPGVKVALDALFDAE